MYTATEEGNRNRSLSEQRETFIMASTFFQKAECWNCVYSFIRPFTACLSYLLPRL